MTAKNFAHQDLRGRSFKGQDLSDADFSYTDIRGTNFKNAKLVGADFTGARAGIQKRWMAVQLLITLLVFSIITLIMLFLNASYVIYFITSKAVIETGFLPGILTLFSLMLGTIFIMRHGLTVKSVAFICVMICILIPIYIILEVIITLTGGKTGVTPLYGILGIIPIGCLYVIAFLGFVYVSGFINTIAAIISSCFVTEFLISSTTIKVSNENLIGIICVFIVNFLLSIHVAIRITKEDMKFAVIRSAGLWLGILGGTSFKNADLTDVNFTEAKLNNTNFSSAIVMRTCWHNTQKLDRTKRTGTILNDVAIRNLLVTGEGQHQDYRGKNLKGANLVGADLTEANLTEADITEATLENTYLAGVNLTKIQALGTNFHNAVLTGACLEAWNIDSTTQLDGVICDYVYLLNGQRERRPNSGTFGPSEFTKLFEEVLDTIDLIFKNGIDWKAFMVSFNSLKVAYKDADIQVQAIENKGDGVFVVRLAAPPEIDKAAVHSGFMQDYEHQLKLLEAKSEFQRVQIEQYKQENIRLERIIEWSMQRPINVQTTAIAGENNKNTHIEGNATNLAINQGEQSGNIDISSNV